MQQALTAVIICSGVMLKVCPKEAAASWERFSGLQKTFLLHQMLPLSPGRVMPVFPVSEAAGSWDALKKPKFSQYR